MFLPILFPFFQAVLSNQTNLDDLNLNLESFQGGLDCNVEEVSLGLFGERNEIY